MKPLPAAGLAISLPVLALLAAFGLGSLACNTPPAPMTINAPPGATTSKQGDVTVIQLPPGEYLADVRIPVRQGGGFVIWNAHILTTTVPPVHVAGSIKSAVYTVRDEHGTAVLIIKNP